MPHLAKRTLFTWAVAGLLNIAIFGVIGCSSTANDPEYWKQSIPNAGSFSSPQAADFNGDGILDIVMGGANREDAKTDYGVFALDGKTGDVLWNVPSRNQVVGTPKLEDINGDKVPDVLIGGRSAIFYAIDGRRGKVMWEFMPEDEFRTVAKDSATLNFYSPQLIPDQDRDGIKDVLVSYGGLTSAPSYQKDRPAGRLMALSSKTGDVLSRVRMPDKKETYMSPLVHDFDGNGKLSVIFGSGGETISGHLYKADLKSVLEGDLSNVKTLATGEEKGFIAPPVLVNLDDDNTKDIVVNSFGGTTYSIDGNTNKILWNTELGGNIGCYTVPAPGNFKRDNRTDFAVSCGHGEWPNMDFTSLVLLNGDNGKIVSKDTLGKFQYASPLTFDFTDDGYDDALVVVNNKNGNMFVNELQVIDFYDEERYTFHKQKVGSNLGSNPLLVDVDNDGYLDVFYGYVNDPIKFYSFKSLKVERIETDFQVEGPVPWGQYMGTYHDD